MDTIYLYLLVHERAILLCTVINIPLCTRLAFIYVIHCLTSSLCHTRFVYTVRNDRYAWFLQTLTHIIILTHICTHYIIIIIYIYMNTYIYL